MRRDVARHWATGNVEKSNFLKALGGSLRAISAETRALRPLESGEEWKYMKFILIIAHLSLFVPFVLCGSLAFLLRTYACLPPSLGSCNMLSKARTTTQHHIILLATLRSVRWLNMGNCWTLEGGLSASKHESMKYARIVMCLTRLSDKVMCVVCWPGRALRSTSCCIHLRLAGRTTHEHVAYQHTHIYGLAPLTQFTSRFVRHLSWRDRDYLEVKTFEYRMRTFWGCQWERKVDDDEHANDIESIS